MYLYLPISTDNTNQPPTKFRDGNIVGCEFTFQPVSAPELVERVFALAAQPESSDEDLLAWWTHLRQLVPRLIIRAFAHESESIELLEAIQKHLIPDLKVPWAYLPTPNGHLTRLYGARWPITRVAERINEVTGLQ